MAKGNDGPDVADQKILVERDAVGLDSPDVSSEIPHSFLGVTEIGEKVNSLLVPGTLGPRGDQPLG